MSKELTWNDVWEGMNIRDPMKQQLFFLSRFFDIPQKQLEQMPIPEIYPMITEMNEYFEQIAPGTGFTMASEDIDPTEYPPEFSERIEDRSQILDL